MLNLSNALKIYLQDALEKAFPNASDFSHIKDYKLDPILMPASKPEFGDFQANGALPLAKALKKNPREVANLIIEKLNQNEKFLSICEEPEIAGPGFINIRIKNNSLLSEIKKRLIDKRLCIPRIADVPNKKSIVVDFSSPNIAKEMHVGHLRSTIIGDCLSRVLEFRGYTVLRINHVGDWGTQFGMLITYLKSVAPKALKKADFLDIGDLVMFYKEAKKLFDENLEFKEKSRNEVISLQKGNADSVLAWELLCDQSRKEFQKIYSKLDIDLTERGESFYNKFLELVIKDLKKIDLLITDQGAKCVVLKSLKGKDGNPLPMIIQKSDGGFNYATTDLAALKYRLNRKPHGDGAYKVIYVTDSGQANHFKGIFEIATRAKWIPEGCSVKHVPFGLVQGEDGKKLKTRSGETVKLKDLIEEAVNYAEKDLRERLKKEGREESEGFIKKVSSIVGIDAIKYADLSQNRVTNYQFSYEKMLALNGNTAPYLLYALVRISGLARKGGTQETKLDNLEYYEKQEWNLIRELLKFDQIIIELEDELLPNRLCNYLFELSQVFNRFYDQIPILNAEEPSRSSRLALCKITAKTLEIGMDLLGMKTLERM